MKYFTLTNILLAFYTLVLGFFLGILFGAAIPLPWPYGIIGGYLLGFISSSFISFELTRRWKAPAYTKLFASLILLAVIAAISVRLQLMNLMLAKLQFSLMSR